MTLEFEIKILAIGDLSVKVAHHNTEPLQMSREETFHCLKFQCKIE